MKQKILTYFAAGFTNELKVKADLVAGLRDAGLNVRYSISDCCFIVTT